MNLLGESENWHGLVLELLSAIYWTTDENLRLTSIGGSVLAGLNLEPGRLLGKRMIDVLPTHNEDHMVSHRRAWEGEQVEYTFELMDRYYECHLKPVRHQDEIVCVLGIALDVTAQKQADKALQHATSQLSVILEALPVVS